jgi:dihydropteroate synthase
METKSTDKDFKQPFPMVMGIINLSPDSFFKQSRVKGKKELFMLAEKHLRDGAAILDIGACSTRPGSTPVDEKTELELLIPALNFLRKEFPDALLSADTFRWTVAREALQSGIEIINDVSGGMADPEMRPGIRKTKAVYILTHCGKKWPNQIPEISDPGAITEVKKFFLDGMDYFLGTGVTLWLDPGFGFGKTLEDNYRILENMEEISELGLPLVFGVSRKSMIQKVIDVDSGKALNGSTVLNTIGLIKGAGILRVHDVREACEAIKIFNFTRNVKQSGPFINSRHS